MIGLPERGTFRVDPTLPSIPLFRGKFIAASRGSLNSPSAPPVFGVLVNLDNARLSIPGPSVVTPPPLWVRGIGSAGARTDCPGANMVESWRAPPRKASEKKDMP